MDWIDLGNPKPRQTPAAYVPLKWPQGSSTVVLEEPRAAVGRDFADVLNQRRSCREFGPLPADAMLAIVGALLSMSCRVQSVGDDSLGFPISRRPSPSAGAIHPIHVIVNVPGFGCWHRFDPNSRQLVELPTSVAVDEVRTSLDAVLPASNAALVLFVAEPSKTAAKYEHSESLVWRDAGVLQGIFAMAAEALGLGCTLLGITGDPWSRQLLDKPGLQGVGAAFVGRPVSPGDLDRRATC